MSKQQIEGSITTVIVIIANMLFDRKWKPYKARGNMDLSTLPSMKNLLHTEPLFKAMVLNATVEEIMDETIKASITFSNDGSSMSGVGAYVVQSLTINVFSVFCQSSLRVGRVRKSYKLQLWKFCLLQPVTNTQKRIYSKRLTLWWLIAYHIIWK